MELTINGLKYNIPFSLGDITLSQFIEYYKQFGRSLDEAAQELLNKTYEGPADYIEVQKQIDIDTHIDAEALAWFCFWGKMEMEAAKNSPGIETLLNDYRVLKNLIIEDENRAQFPVVVTWAGEDWLIQDFVVDSASNMTFNEIVTSKEAMKQTHALGFSKWESMPYLCAVFFRKKGEPFSDELVYEKSERIKMMYELPMSHVLMVAFFLNSCVSIWNNTLQFSARAAAEKLSQN